MLLVGARATQHWFPAEARPTSSWDVWFVGDAFDRWLRTVPARVRAEQPLRGGRTLYVVEVQGAIVRALVAPPGGSEQAFHDAAPGDLRCGRGPCAEARVASVEALALIKRSHLYDPADWHKHVEDYEFLKSRRDARAVAPAVMAAGALRMREWIEQHPEDRGSGSMRIPNEAFFANTRAARIRAYEHDGLHRATCYGEHPLYRRLKDEPGLAFVSARHFEAMSHLEKVRLVREETYAIALERVVIPSMETGTPWDPQRAFRHALRRICTNLTKGWFRDFAIENYGEVAHFDVDYVARFSEAVASGTLARLPGLPQAQTWRTRLVEHLAEIARLDAEAALSR